jgi:tetratricopeptide (TPR) repeat protein
MLDGAAAIIESVDIYRRLTESNPAVHEAGLARALANLGRYLEVGRAQDAALAALEESVAIRRRLAITNPAVHERDLARALTTRARLLMQQGDLDRALCDTGEAVELYRLYIAAMPFELSHLYLSLSLQADVLDRLGRQEEAEGVRRWLRSHAPPHS